MCFVLFSSLDEHVTTRPVQLRLYLEDGAFRFQAVRLDDIGLMTDLTVSLPAHNMLSTVVSTSGTTTRYRYLLS